MYFSMNELLSVYKTLLGAQNKFGSEMRSQMNVKNPGLFYLVSSFKLGQQDPLKIWLCVFKIMARTAWRIVRLCSSCSQSHIQHFIIPQPCETNLEFKSLNKISYIIKCMSSSWYIIKRTSTAIHFNVTLLQKWKLVFYVLECLKSWTWKTEVLKYEAKSQWIHAWNMHVGFTENTKFICKSHFLTKLPRSCLTCHQWSLTHVRSLSPNTGT